MATIDPRKKKDELLGVPPPSPPPGGLPTATLPGGATGARATPGMPDATAINEQMRSYLTTPAASSKSVEKQPSGDTTPSPSPAPTMPPPSPPPSMPQPTPDVARTPAQFQGWTKTGGPGSGYYIPHLTAQPGTPEWYNAFSDRLKGAPPSMRTFIFQEMRNAMPYALNSDQGKQYLDNVNAWIKNYESLNPAGPEQSTWTDPWRSTVVGPTGASYPTAGAGTPGQSAGAPPQAGSTPTWDVATGQWSGLPAAGGATPAGGGGAATGTPAAAGPAGPPAVSPDMISTMQGYMNPSADMGGYLSQGLGLVNDQMAAAEQQGLRNIKENAASRGIYGGSPGLVDYAQLEANLVNAGNQGRLDLLDRNRQYGLDVANLGLQEQNLAQQRYIADRQFQLQQQGMDADNAYRQAVFEWQKVQDTNQYNLQTQGSPWERYQYYVNLALDLADKGQDIPEWLRAVITNQGNPVGAQPR